MNKIWTAKNGLTVYNTGAFYVPRDIVNLIKIVNSNGYVKFIINGKRYMFKRAKEERNRICGMGEIRHLFKQVDEFKCEFDPRRKLIIIKIDRVRKSISKTKDRRTSVRKSSKGPNNKEKYFLRKIGLKEQEYVYKGNIRGSGHDFEITSAKATKIGRYVEVKGIRNKVHTINLTNQEYDFAKKHKKNYILYLIEKQGSRKVMYRIPFMQLDHAPDSYTFRFRKREMDSFEVM